MRIKRLTVIIFCLVLLASILAYGQTWNEEAMTTAKSILQEKFQLEDSLAFNQEGVLAAEMLQAFPASVQITDEGLAEGLTVALIKYGEELFFPLFVGSVPELDPPYGFALMNEEGETLSVGPATVEGTEEGPEVPIIELLEEREQTYYLALKFTEGTIKLELPKRVT
ncbi:hypothetical protein K9M06_05275 [Candidatus Bipolaricaulota bacterium]|nr:hypothetical protein [Candidatus Bipolaricaulota bacterium]